ncbi:MAG: DUF2911 domain-containing protein [Flavobacteriales bacterium]|nr:DUF2911 domain-containing protein [Flavobacteriales bacterium]MBP6572986.1 DUF2911 domain-containing protein [Flavobacteriales bacterium]
MKRILLSSLIISASVLVSAQDLPAPSPLGKVEQVVGLTTVKVEYSRPSAKGRVVFGSLVPYDKMWRTGANACTKVSFSGPVMIGGAEVPAGKYALVTIPNEKVWQVMLNSDTTISGTEGYDEGKNVAMLKADVKHMTNPTETFTIGFDAVKDDRAQLELRWEKTMVSIEIHADAMDQAMGNIKEAMNGTDVKAGTYHRSARFYLDRGIDNAQALAWAKQADSMEKKYWMKHTLALCYAANGQKQEAIAAAKESMAMAETEKDNQYVKLNQEKIAEWSK